MSQSVIWGVLMALQGVTVLGVIGVFFRVGKFVGVVETESRQNETDHKRFGADIRKIHERIDTLPTR